MTAQRASQLVEAGVWLQATGDHAGARRLFEQALKLDPESVRAKQFLSKSPAASPAPALVPAPAAAPGKDELLPPPISTGTVNFGAWQNPFAPPPLAPAIADLDLRALASAQPRANPFEPETLPFDVPIFGGAKAPSPPVEPPPPAVELSPPSPSPGGADPWFTPVESAWDLGDDRGLEIDTSGPRDKDAFALVTEAHTPLPFSNNARTPSQELRIEDEVRTLLRGAADLIGLDDHSGALDLLQKALQLQPGNAEAEQLRQKAERTLLAMYESKIGRLDGTPRIAIKQDEIIWLNLDHRAGFVLAQIDGQVTYDDLFAICGMSRLDTARILAQLDEQGVIATKR